MQIHRALELSTAAIFAIVAIVVFLFASCSDGQTTQPAFIPNPPEIVYPTTQRVRNISTSAELRTVTSGDYMKLAPGTYSISTTIQSSAKNVVIDMSAGATIQWVGVLGSSVFSINESGDLWHFKGGSFQFSSPPVGRTSVAVTVRGSHVTLESVTVRNGQLFMLRGARNFTALRCGSGQIVPFYWGFADVEKDWLQNRKWNTDTRIEMANVGGSIAGHDIRVYNCDRFWILGGTLKNPDSIVRPAGIVHGEAINIIDGKNYYIKSVSVEGPCRAGPLPMASNAANSVVNVRIDTCTFKDTYWMLESGLSAFQMQRCTTTGGNGSGSLFSIREPYGGKAKATGSLTNNTLTFTRAGQPAGSPFSGASSTNWIGSTANLAVRNRNNTFNGRAMN